MLNSLDYNVALGFDFGMRRIGIAVGQTITGQASPVSIVFAKSGVPNWHEIDKIIDEWKPDVLVVGIPFNMDGTEHALTIAARHFGEQLMQHSSLPVFYIDERLSTVEARSQIFERKGYRGLQNARLDSYAACIILQSWFTQQKTGQ